MNFKNPPARFFAALLAFVMGSVVIHAQDSISTNEGKTNTVSAPAESSTAGTNTTSSTNFASNSIPVAKTKHDRGILAGGGTHHESGAGYNPGNAMLGKTVIALAAVVCPFLVVFSLPVAIIVTVFYFRHRQNIMMHETIRTMVERGVPVTPEFIAGLNPRGFNVNIQGKWDVQKHRNQRLLPGLILTGVGLALIGMHPFVFARGGVIVLIIGLAFLIVWLVERKQNNNDARRATTGGVQPAEKKEDNESQKPKE